MLCNVSTAPGGADFFDEMGRLHVASNVVQWILEELHVALDLSRQCIVHDVMHEVDKSGVTPEHGGEEVGVASERNNLEHRQQFFIFSTDVSDAD